MLIAFSASAQIAISEDFDSGASDWETGGFFFSATQACSGQSVRENLYSGNTSGDLTSPNIVGQSNATDLSLSFDYKIVDWSAATDATPPGWGNFVIQYSTDDGANWIDIDTIDDSNHTTSSDCATLNYTIVAADLPMGSDFKLQFVATQTGGDYYLYFDNISALQIANNPPSCDSILTTPVDGETAADIDGNISWSTASGIPTGYFLTVGTAPGGNDVVDNLDVGNVTTYALGQLNYATTYYVTITAYNANGTTTDTCTEQSFTTQDDPNAVVDCAAGPVVTNFCYFNDIDDDPSVATFSYTSSDGSQLILTFNTGQVESCCDELVVLDSDGVTQLFNGTNGGDLTGLTFQSTGDNISWYINSDFSINCQDSGFTPVEASVVCATCNNPSATYDVRSDCANGPQFFIDVDLTDLGSASSITISDDQGSADQTTSAPGMFTFGPFPNATDVTITVANDDDASCTLTSDPLTQPFCLDNIVDCTAGPLNTSYCYQNNESNVFQYTSSDGSPLNLVINSGAVEGLPWDTLVILDSDGVTELYNDEGNGGDISGLSFQSTGDTIFFTVQSDGVVSCAAGSAGLSDGIEYTVSCATCENPTADFAVVSDCVNGPQFFIDVDLTSVGSASSITLSDNQGSATQTASAPGVFTFGPYPNTTDVEITVTNDDDANCLLISDPLTQPFCIDNIVDCTAGPLNTSYCYENNESNVFQYTSSDGSPLNLVINSGAVEGLPWDTLVILDSDGVTELYNDEGNNGDISGLSFQSTGDTIFFTVQSDGVVSCASGSAGLSDGIDYTVSCATCINPAATYTVIDDCDNGDQFLIDVNVTSLGDANSLTISNNIDANTVAVNATGVYQVGPFPFLTDVIVTITSDDDVNCVINSQPIQLADCPPENDNCVDATLALVNADDTCDLINPGTLLEATPSGVPGGTCNGDPDDDVWYQFTALNETQIIILENISGAFGPDNLDHAVYEGDCGSLIELYCSDNTASVTPTLVVGNTYYIRVFSAGSDNETTTFDLCIRPGSNSVIVDQTTYTVDELVQDILIGGECAQISNITSSTGTDFGEDNGIGYFSIEGSGFPFEEGVILTSGNASLASGPNVNAMSEGSTAWPGDAELNAAVGITSNNASIIEFDFIPLAQEISFDFLMASEEYDGDQGGTFECTFSDAFAFLLTDPDGVTTNLAVLPGTNTPILVTNIHPENPGCAAVNEEFFGGYTPQNLPPISFDGRTAVFTAQAPVIVGETYHIKLVIADATDTALDSGVYLRAGSFDLGELNLGEDITIASGEAACLGEPIVLDTQAPNLEHVWFKDGILIDGETSSTLTVTEPDLYTAQVIFSNQCFLTDEILVEFLEPPVANQPPNLVGCSIDGITLFQLDENDDPILGTQDPANYTVTYHETEQDAIDGINALNSPYENISNPQTIYARVEDNTTGCYATTSFDLVFGLLPLANFPEDFDYEVCPNATVPIEITAVPDNFTAGEVTIAWFLDGGLIPGETGLTLPVLVAGTYTIEVTFNDTGCSNAIDIDVIELESCVIPQGISPNNDGVNDVFDLSSYDVVRLEIFNRNGTLVYSKSNYTNEWVGQTNDGEELPVGTYFYTMVYEGGAKSRSAWIYINR